MAYTRSSKRALRLSGSALALAMLLSACGAAETTGSEGNETEPADSAEPTAGDAASGEPSYGGTASTFASTDPGSLDPAALGAYDQMVIAPNIVEGLFRLSPDGQEIEPGLAQDHSVSDDATTWTFTLNPDATFHNGDSVTAEDFKYSFERVLDPETASPGSWMLEGVVGAAEFQAGTADEVSGLRATDETTFEIELAEPRAFFDALLASPNLAVVPQSAVEEFGEDFGQNVVAAGPFALGEWSINERITLDAHEGYWNGRPYLDHVEFAVIGDENTRVLEFDAGNLDVTWVPPAHWDRFSTEMEDQLGWAETFHTALISVNMDREPFGTDLRLRQAICHALNEEAVISSLQGRATDAQGLVAPGLVGHQEDGGCSYDPERARELLAEAGYPDGYDETLELIMLPWANLMTIFQIYQANLAEIGIDIELRAEEPGPYGERLAAGEFDLAYDYRVATYADPDAFYFPLTHSSSIGGGGNSARYENTELDEVVATARQTMDAGERESAYEEANELVMADLPYIPLSHNIYVDVHQERIQDYVPSPMDWHMYHRVWVEE